ncbi:hypothetical protein BDBG_02676 [Blastomyces gilchristii SLH14081]|uniref:Uncharacterized protein n=1 Tax=Blastomyces gilchristii (strain SLH14081) TaxID=559298 RepID=A0A179UH82_BLAGS|nr:uncharacterized protein BDBG_02676 [Blastomyces gilchristii SLH14081]OAT06487.1 hypothetical protein BDBG_02676 [Blastomyces gilchristii SLH14081]
MLVTVSEIKLFSESSLNDYIRSYITVLIERGSSVATVMRGAEEELNMNKLTGRRDDISLQGTATTTAAVRDAEEGGDVIMRAVLPRLIETTVSTFNLAFLMIMEAAAAS